MLSNFLIRSATAIILIMSARYLFGDTFIVGWLTYIVYNITDTLLTNSLKEGADESK
jgi:hypothetical protein